MKIKIIFFDSIKRVKFLFVNISEKNKIKIKINQIIVEIGERILKFNFKLLF